MRIVRVLHEGSISFAELLADEVGLLDADFRVVRRVALEQAVFLPPALPTKVVCVGLNYLAHARELGKELPGAPLLFLKPPSAIVGSGETVTCPEQSREVHYEGELAAVMGKTCRRAGPEQARSCILGYTCANDVTARDLQRTDGLYARAKGFDTFCPLGPWIETEIESPGDLGIVTRVNGEIRQQGRTSDMVFPVPGLVSFVSQIMTLQPGDVVLTGTPPGVGEIRPGDSVQVEIEGIGVLQNPVAGAG
jgi:2-keto-4-pentenoate hydratase/2-oxohepta-3-ene-1,7-dioic acid hydratase in catechol pathway